VEQQRQHTGYFHSLYYIDGQDHAWYGMVWYGATR